MTFKTDDRVFETSITTGVGTYSLDGAQVGFATFAGMGANSDCPYFATDDINWEVGIGTVLTAPNRLQRTTILRSSNADAAVNWGAGTRKIRCGLAAAMALPRLLSKSVAGGVDVALTTDEQRRRILIFTGVLTGNINVTVDTSPWDWDIYNNTTGLFTLTVKTAAGTGVAVTQGRRAVLQCDGVNVVSPTSDVALPIVTAPALLNSWANYTAGRTNASYYKDPFGIVHIEGTIAGGTSIGAVMFTLPAGYRPGAEMDFACSANQVGVLANGNVYGISGSTGYVPLNGITFRAVN